MNKNPSIRLGHLKIIDHLVLGISDLLLKRNEPLNSDVNLEPVTMNTWPQVMDALISDEINGAFLPAPIAMHLYSRGVNLKILMQVHRAGSLFVKRNTESINSINDFKGKTILVPSPFSIQVMLLHRMLASAGLKFSDHTDIKADVVFETAPPFLMPEILSNDDDLDIAGYAVAEPYASAGISKGIVKKICTTASLWKNHPCCVFVIKPDFLHTHQNQLKELIKIFVSTGEKLSNPKNDEILDTAEKFLKLDKALIRQQIKETEISFKPDQFLPDPDSFEVIQTYMVDTMNVLNKRIDIDQLIESELIASVLAGE